MNTRLGLSRVAAGVCLGLLLCTPTAHGYTVFCGPGTGNCGHTPESISSGDPAWATTDEPGTLSLVNTGLTLAYDPTDDVFVVKWHGATKVETTLEAAKQVAVEWMARVRWAGMTP